MNVITKERAERIKAECEAKAAANGGLWFDQMKRVFLVGEECYLLRVWDVRGGSRLDAFMAILNGERFEANPAIVDWYQGMADGIAGVTHPAERVLSRSYLNGYEAGRKGPKVIPSLIRSFGRKDLGQSILEIGVQVADDRGIVTRLLHHDGTQKDDWQIIHTAGCYAEAGEYIRNAWGSVHVTDSSELLDVYDGYKTAAAKNAGKTLRASIVRMMKRGRSADEIADTAFQSMLTLVSEF